MPVFTKAVLSAEGDASKYLRKDQGDLKRLRQELLIAWKLRKAGTHELKPHAFGQNQHLPDLQAQGKGAGCNLKRRPRDPLHQNRC